MVFGECSVLNDGRRVTAVWNDTGIYIADTFIEGPQLRLPDAAMTPTGRIWVVGAGQHGGVHVWSAATGWQQIPNMPPFGTRTIIRADGEGCRIAVAVSPTAWACVSVAPNGTVTQQSTGAIINGAGAAGMRDWDVAGAPRTSAPLDTQVAGQAVRGAVGIVTQIGAALPPLPDQIVVARGGQAGTLQLGAVEWSTLRLAPNGRWWVGTQFGATPKVFGGAVPTILPPLITSGEPPVPPQPPSLPAKATIASFQTPIQEGGTSRAVAKVTQGTPEQFRWQWMDAAGTWHTGALNPASDRDHTFNRPNGTQDNVFPSGAGRFPIRLQTIVNGLVMDQSSSTSRVIEVQSSVTPEPPIPPIPIEPPTPLPPGTARLGVPRGNGFQIIDDSGGWLAWGTSAFWLNGGYLREKQRAVDNLAWIAGERIDFARVIATGLKKDGVECSISPKDPNFQSTIAGLADEARAHGLRLQWSIFGATYDAPTKAERAKAVDLFCEALKGREASVQLVEIANEGWQNGFEGDAGRDELKDLVARVWTHLPAVLVAPTCPKPGDDVSPDKIEYYYKNTQATIQTHHYSRSTKAPDGVWRPTRKPWRESKFAVNGCCLLCQNNEPRGPDSSGTQTHDPLVLAMDAVTTWLCGVSTYVLHTGAGIFGIADPSRGRPANLWETTDIAAINSAIRTSRALLPPDLPNWTKHQANASSNPFTFVDVPEEQFTLAYAATSGNQIIQPVGGVVKDTTFTLRTGRCQGKVYHPVTGQVLEVFDQSYHAKVSQPAIIVMATRV